jgi:hypothetical protein
LRASELTLAPRAARSYGPRESARAEAFSDEGRLRVDAKLATFARPATRGAFGQARTHTHAAAANPKHTHTRVCALSATLTHALPLQGAEERELSAALLQALRGCVLAETFPKSSVDIYVLVLQADGGELPAAAMAASLALAHAGIATRDIVTACTVVRFALLVGS